MRRQKKEQNIKQAKEGRGTVKGGQKNITEETSRKTKTERNIKKDRHVVASIF